MHAFKDAAGKDWLVEINVGAIKRVRALVAVDLLALEDGAPPLLTRLGMDVVLLCDVVFALIEPQAKAAGVTDEQFGASLGGEAILHAHAAFYQELTGFFRSLQRPDLVMAIAKQAEMIGLAVRTVEQRLTIIDPAAEVEVIFGERSTNSPESVESAPTP